MKYVLCIFLLAVSTQSNTAQEDQFAIDSDSDSIKNSEQILDLNDDDTTNQELAVPVSDERSMSAGVQTQNPRIINRVRAVCYLEDGTYIVTQSDIERPRVDGTLATFEDLCVDPFICQEARQFNINRDPEMVDKYFDEVCRTNNIGKKQLEQILTNAGYTYEEAREQIGMLMQVNSFFGFKFGAGRLTISDKEIQAEYDKNPQYEELQICIERLFVPSYAADTAEKAYALVQKNDTAVVKNQPFWIKQSELAADKQLFFSMELNEISPAYETINGYEFFRVLDRQEKQLVSFETRRTELANKLYRDRFIQSISEYKKELLARSPIVYFE